MYSGKNISYLIYRCLNRCIRQTKDVSTTTGNGAVRVFSGIQPTGIPHLGNYLGAIQQWVDLQDVYSDVMYSIVDLHSITIPQKPELLRENIQMTAACLIASGLDYKKCILFQQSKVQQHTELGWILGCLCNLTSLQGLPQWKDKSKKVKGASLGLLVYPVLQASDILVYKSTVVPVGEDQVTHIELARDVARSFNNLYGEVFPLPECRIGNTPKIRSLRDPSVKMSKSDISYRSFISILDTDDEILYKIKQAKTDFNSEVTYNSTERPGVANLIEIHSALTKKSYEDICKESITMDTGKYKLHLADVVIQSLRPIRERTLQLLDDRSYLNKVLLYGAERASELAERTLKQVKSKMGLS